MDATLYSRSRLSIRSRSLVVKKGETSLKTNRILAVLSLILIFSSLAVSIEPVSSQLTVVKVDPSLIEYYVDATGQQFTVAIKIVDVVNLYGFDIRFRWNTTFLDYVSHSVYVPKDTYTDGVLWNPVILVKDEVNTTTGTYWIACASSYPAPCFNGTGTVFNMTFSVIHHPVEPEPDACITLELYRTDLATNDAVPIPHTGQQGTVVLYAHSASRDVAVTDVKPWKTIVGQGFACKINVTIANQGGFTETFNVTIYTNTTSIATQTIALTSGNYATVTFTWNTTGVAKGNYAISAYAWPILGETDTTDNTCMAGVVTVTIPGDVDGDFDVDIYDVVKITSVYWSKVGEPEYRPNSDINGDGIIDIYDVVRCTSHYGETDP